MKAMNSLHATLRTSERVYSSPKSTLYRGVWGNRPVAIKQIPRRFCVMDPSGRSLESSALEELQGCRHVVRHFQTSYEKDSVFIMMEWIQGQHLKQHIQGRKQPLPEERVRDIVRQIATFLCCCQKKNLIYADMKPENVLISADGEIRVVDFGCTRDAQQAPKAYMGTPIYFPPEMFGKVLLPEHDVWGLGMVAYYLACGRHPFLACDPTPSLEFPTVEYSIVNNPLHFQHPAWALWSPEGIYFMQRLLQKDPIHRPTISAVLRMPWLDAAN